MCVSGKVSDTVLGLEREVGCGFCSPGVHSGQEAHVGRAFVHGLSWACGVLWETLAVGDGGEGQGFPGTHRAFK